MLMTNEQGPAKASYLASNFPPNALTTVISGHIPKVRRNARKCVVMYRDSNWRRKRAVPRCTSTPAYLSPSIYVVRNSPNQVLGEDSFPNVYMSADKMADALTAAFRAEVIVVNHLKVGSIAALRLSHPTGPISLVTGDGCPKDFLLNVGPTCSTRPV